jgi:hypothetical protein
MNNAVAGCVVMPNDLVLAQHNEVMSPAIVFEKVDLLKQKKSPIKGR